MPYITQEDREKLKKDTPNNSGELNYTFTTLIVDKTVSEKQGGNLEEQIRNVIDNYILKKGLRYQYCNDIMGAIVGCSMELVERFGETYLIEVDILGNIMSNWYREVVRPYEDTKIKSNGDVINQG